MISLPPNIDQQDVMQWLRGGYFYVLNGEENRKEIATLQGLVNLDYPEDCPEDAENWGLCVRMLHHPRKLLNVTIDDVKPHWPMCGSLNIEDEGDTPFAVMLHREARRQWRRTFNERCLSLTVPRLWYVRKHVHVPSSSADTRVIEAAFRPKYYEFEQAKRDIESGRSVSVAINRHIILASRDKGGLLVYYNGELAGRVEDRILVCRRNSTIPQSRILKLLGEGVDHGTRC